MYFLGYLLSKKKVDAYSNYLKINGDKSELASAEITQYRIQLEGEMNANTIQAFNIIILGITALIILWYSVEAKRLADLTEKQIKIKLRPVIIIDRVYGNWIDLKNVGESVAVSIKIRPIQERSFSGSADSYEIHFNECPVLEQGATATLTGHFRKQNTEGWTTLTHPDPLLDYTHQSFVNSYDILIHFNDIENGGWETRTRVDNLGTHFQSMNEKRE